jgi:hypothetical protein
MPVHTREEAYSTLGRIMFQRVRIACSVRSGNFRKIHFQGLPSFLYVSKRCSSRPSHLMFFLMLGSSSLEHLLSSLIGSGSLLLKPPSSSLLDGSLTRDTGALASTALPCWGRIRVASLWVGSASTVVDAIAPESQDAV